MNIVLGNVTTKGFTSLEEMVKHIFGTTAVILNEQVLSHNSLGHLLVLDISGKKKAVIKYPPTTDFYTGLKIVVSERIGLTTLRQLSNFRVPEVYGIIADEMKKETALVMEYIETKPAPKNKKYWILTGQKLAQMHISAHDGNFDSHLNFLNDIIQMHQSKIFGFIEDNFIGLSPQANAQEESWIRFFGTHRLRAQAMLARKLNHFDDKDLYYMNLLIQRLPLLLIEPKRPSLVHGDLWKENCITSIKEAPVLIDPSCHFAHFEVDLAMTELFGGFPKPFYDAYNEINPITQDYKERKKIYNLYHLINHLNIFGKSYLPQVSRIIRDIVEGKS